MSAVSRRGVITAATMLALCGVLVLGAVWGWRFLFAEIPDPTPAAEPSESCTTQQVDAGERIRARQVQVSVYNSGTRSGLAGSTLDALLERGFKAGEAGNAPSDVDVNKVQVWSTIPGDAEARLVARQFGKKLKVRVSDVDLGPGVDVIVGDKFRKLVRAKKTLRVTEPQEICVPIAPSPTATETGSANG